MTSSRIRRRSCHRLMNGGKLPYNAKGAPASGGPPPSFLIQRSAAAVHAAALDAIAGVLPIAEELLIGHHRLVGMVGQPVSDIGVVAGHPDHQPAGFLQPAEHRPEIMHGALPWRRGGRPERRPLREW